MNELLRRETDGLIKSWMRHEEGMLRDYLVMDVEDPRINTQSILIRHFLVEALFGDRFAALMEQELRFAAVMNWLLGVTKKSGSSEDFSAILHSLDCGADNAEGLPIPNFVLQTFEALPATVDEMAVPNYLREALSMRLPAKETESLEPPERSREEAQLPQSAIRNPQSKIRQRFEESWLATFQLIWSKSLANERQSAIRVLEPACGSANDYRFLESFGLARLLEYSGFDLCEKNVRNARAMFAGARFEVGNVFQIDAADNAFDLCFVQDLLEHFSIEAMEQAVAEICRVTREGICVGFFNMHEEDDHVVRPVEDYHWNTLSLARTSGLFERRGFAVQPVHIGTFLKWRFGCGETQNENAYTFFAASH